MKYFVTAIGTDSGKTLASAILCEALGADYWKPIQAGFPTDSEMIKSLTTDPTIRIWPESFLLTSPSSPHAAAIHDGVEITLNKIVPPAINKPLIIEGAGGCLVPINESEFVIDLASHCNASIILVANLYLGSINHTLLTASFLTQRGYPIKGIIFNGPSNPQSEEIILHHTHYPVLLRINQEKEINKSTVAAYSKKINTQLL